MLAIIAAWWSRHRVRYSTSSSSESSSGSTDLHLPVLLIEAGLTLSSHSRSCSRQSFPRDDLLGALEAFRDLSSATGTSALVAEAVDVPHLIVSMSIP